MRKKTKKCFDIFKEISKIKKKKIIVLFNAIEAYQENNLISTDTDFKNKLNKLLNLLKIAQKDKLGLRDSWFILQNFFTLKTLKFSSNPLKIISKNIEAFFDNIKKLLLEIIEKFPEGNDDSKNVLEKIKNSCDDLMKNTSTIFREGEIEQTVIDIAQQQQKGIMFKSFWSNIIDGLMGISKFNEKKIEGMIGEVGSACKRKLSQKSGVDKSFDEGNRCVYASTQSMRFAHKSRRLLWLSFITFGVATAFLAVGGVLLGLSFAVSPAVFPVILGFGVASLVIGSFAGLVGFAEIIGSRMAKWERRMVIHSRKRKLAHNISKVGVSQPITSQKPRTSKKYKPKGERVTTSI